MQNIHNFKSIYYEKKYEIHQNKTISKQDFIDLK